MHTAEEICRMIDALVDDMFAKFEECLFYQAVGIPMGTNCAPLVANHLLYLYENDLPDSLFRSGHGRLARSFNICYRYIGD